MLLSIISCSIWIHYTQEMAVHTDTALRIFGDSIAADNQYVIVSSVVATSVLFLIYAAVMFGLSLWRALLEAEVDMEGIVRDKLQLYQMANTGVRVCWWAVMTWMVVLMIGNGIFGIYVTNIKFMLTETLANIELLGAYVRGPYPDCPANCLDLWVVDYIKTSRAFGCICNKSTLQAALAEFQSASNAISGSLVGVFMMYVVAGFWRSDLSKQYASVRKEQDIAKRLAGGGAAAGSGGRGAAAPRAAAAGRTGGTGARPGRGR